MGDESRRLADVLEACANVVEAATVQSFRHEPSRTYEQAVRLRDLLNAMLTTAASDARELSYTNPRDRARHLSPPPFPPS